MKVKDILRSPAITIGQESTLREAVELLSKSGVSGLPVVNAEGQLVGIVTEHDIIKALLPTYEDILTAGVVLLDAGLMEDRVYKVRDNPVSSIMSTNVVTLAEEDTILKAASTVILKKIKRLPIVRDRKPVGIVSRIDIVQAVMQGRTLEARDARR